MLVKLKIAETIIEFSGNKKEDARLPAEYKNFVYNGKGKSDILINIIRTNNLPRVKGAESLFITRHNIDKEEAWQLLKKMNAYIYLGLIKEKKQVVFINPGFNQVDAHCLSSNSESFIWHIQSLVDDFLQILLINYFAQRKTGIFAHAAGIKDLNGKGFIFAGKSGCGKSTTAKIWDKHSRAMVLNDDRVIVKKPKGKFTIYPSPWHGELSKYLYSPLEQAPLDQVFFLRHSRKNNIKVLGPNEAFLDLYPAIFPPFWSSDLLNNAVYFCHDLAVNIKCSRLGFKKDKDIIEFVRKTYARN